MISTDTQVPAVDFATDELLNFHDTIDQLRTFGNVVPVKFFDRPAWLLHRYDDVKHTIADEVHFQAAKFYKLGAAPAMGRTVQTMANEEHRINRALVSSAFFPKQIRRLLEPLIQSEAHRLLDECADLERIELVNGYSRQYPFGVITRLLGIPLDDDEKFLSWALKLIDYPWDPEGALAAKEAFTQALTPIVHQRRQQPEDDIISLLTQEEIEGQLLSDEEIFSFCRLLFPAGSDTTYKNLGSLLYAVLSDPELCDIVRESPEHIPAIVQEGLRWAPPTATLPRICSKTTQIGDQTIERGEMILLCIAAANSDPLVYDNPRQFDFRREQKNLAFGNGVHFCLGSHLARSELETGLEQLFAHFPDIKLLEEQSVEFFGAVMRGPRQLWASLH